jgi:hypothetical protein
LTLPYLRWCLEKVGAGHRNRTYTALRPPDFESGAPAFSNHRPCGYDLIRNTPRFAPIVEERRVRRQAGDLPRSRRHMDGHTKPIYFVWQYLLVLLQKFGPMLPGKEGRSPPSEVLHRPHVGAQLAVKNCQMAAVGRWAKVTLLTPSALP